MSATNFFLPLGKAGAIMAMALSTTPTIAGESRAHHHRRDEHGFRVQVDYGHQDHHRRGYRGYGHHARGCNVSHWVPPVYETRYGPCGWSYTVLVHGGYHKKIWVPTRYHSSHVRHHYPRHGSVHRRHGDFRVSAHVDF